MISNRIMEDFHCKICIKLHNTVQDGAPKIAFSCLINGLTMVYGRYNYS